MDEYSVLTFGIKPRTFYLEQAMLQNLKSHVKMNRRQTKKIQANNKYLSPTLKLETDLSYMTWHKPEDNLVNSL